MKILIINHYAGSPDLGMEYRPYYMAREWIKSGHQVTIIAASYSHVRSKNPDVNRTFTEQDIDGIRYIFIKTPSYQGNGLARFINMLVFVFRLRYYSKKFANKILPDIVIASSTYPLDNYPAYNISKKCNAKYIYEVHDLWPLSPMELGGLSKNHPFIVLMQLAENYAYKKVDKVVSILPLTLDHMLKHGLRRENWYYVPNGINIEEWENSLSLPGNIKQEINDIRNRGCKIIAYTGSIGIANALDNLLDAASDLKNKNLRFVIVGKGPERERLISRAEKENLDNVLFLAPIPRRSMPEFLDMCDILFIGLQRQPLFRFGISPNKILDYMMAGKPVIQAIDAGNDMVSDAKCGISVKAESKEELVNAIKKIINLDEKDRKTMGQNGKEYVLRNHNYGILADKMMTIFKD